jgi:hypothetical protein
MIMVNLLPRQQANASGIARILSRNYRVPASCKSVFASILCRADAGFPKSEPDSKVRFLMRGSQNASIVDMSRYQRWMPTALSSEILCVFPDDWPTLHLRFVSSSGSWWLCDRDIRIVLCVCLLGCFF